MRINVIDWFLEAEEPFANQPPAQDPTPMAQDGQGQMGQVVDDTKDQPDDVNDDPQIPDVDENDGKDKDFAEWKRDFLKAALAADPDEMVDLLNAVMDRTGLEQYEYRFVHDNLLVQMYRQDNVRQASQEVRRLISDNLDKTNPGTVAMQHLVTVLQKEPSLVNNLIKMTGLYAWKGDMHRKFIAALLGGVQKGSGGRSADILYVGKGFTINFSTRFYTDFGAINIGPWSLKVDDPERFLQEPELERLKRGSPEEKQVLRRRVIIQSIAGEFKERAFLVNVVMPDGTVYCLGWDVGESVSSAYRSGKIVARSRQNVQYDAMISDDGKITPLLDITLMLLRETGEVDDAGKPKVVEVPFLETKNGSLYLMADLETVRHASGVLSGLFFHELPYGGNPSDVREIQRCIPSVAEILNKRCR